MGYYVNPSAESFAAIVRSGIYVDKSGLIAYMNKVVQTDRMLVCSSRPRRFGKSFAAKMLAAYYSRGADARDIFQNLKIAKEPSCENLNQYDVIFLDITHFSFYRGYTGDSSKRNSERCHRRTEQGISGGNSKRNGIAVKSIDAGTHGYRKKSFLLLLMSGMLCFGK